jgi:hypothetical protein
VSATVLGPGGKILCRDCGQAINAETTKLFNGATCTRCYAVRARYPEIYDWAMGLIERIRAEVARPIAVPHDVDGVDESEEERALEQRFQESRLSPCGAKKRR